MSICRENATDLAFSPQIGKLASEYKGMTMLSLIKREKEADKMRKRFFSIFMWLILIIGISLLLYPTISEYWNSFHQTRAIATYQDKIKQLSPEEYKKIWADAKEYNRKLLQQPDRFTMTKKNRQLYDQQLAIADDGLMAYLEIPAIRVSLPVYHGTNEDILAIGVGHIFGSSLPVGGKTTHSVLSGHRGLPSAVLLTHLDQLEKGDVFMIHVLNKTLTYQVNQIKTVTPPEFDDLNIVQDKDYCTLVTCTPYGINTHRLLVRGTRIGSIYGPDISFITADARKVSLYWSALAYGIPLLILLLTILFSYDNWQSKRQRQKAQIWLQMQNEKNHYHVD